MSSKIAGSNDRPKIKDNLRALHSPTLRFLSQGNNNCALATPNPVSLNSHANDYPSCTRTWPRSYGKRGDIHHSFNPKQKHYARTLASLPVKDGEVFELGYEYFHLELGAVSSLINNKGVSEH